MKMERGGAKSRKEYLLDEHGEKIRLKSGHYKSRKIDTVDWNKTEKVEEWRQRYEHITNYHLEKAGIPERIDVRSYERQGMEKTPTIHLGHYAAHLEQRGIPSKRGDINREIQAENKQRDVLTHELAHVEKAIQSEHARQETLKQEARKLDLQKQEAAKLEEIQRQEGIRQKTSSEEALKREEAQKLESQRMVAQEQEARKLDIQKQEAEARRQEESKRQEGIRQKTISEEALRQKAAEWEHMAREHIQQHVPPPESGRLEALAKAAEEREAAQKKAEQAAQAEREAKFQQQRKFLRPHRLERPARAFRKRSRPVRVNWSTLAEALSARREKLYTESRSIDWVKLAQEQEAQRVDWQKLAQQEAGRIDWIHLAEQRGQRSYEELYQQERRPIQKQEDEGAPDQPIPPRTSYTDLYKPHPPDATEQEHDHTHER